MRSWLIDLAIMLGAFAAVSAVAGLLGAANLGTALAFGQIGFGIALVWVMIRAGLTSVAGVTQQASGHGRSGGAGAPTVVAPHVTRPGGPPCAPSPYPAPRPR